MDKIIILTDFSERAAHAADYAVELALKSNSRVELFHAIYVPDLVPSTAGMQPYYENLGLLREESERKLSELAARLTAKMKSGGGHHSEVTYQSEIGNLGMNTANIGQAEKPWMLVMGEKQKKSLFERFIFESDTAAVIDSVNCPVLIVPLETAVNPIKKILFASELEEPDCPALQYLATIANIYDAELTIVHIHPGDSRISEKIDRYLKFKRIRKKINYYNVRYEEFAGKEIDESLIQFSAAEQADILAVRQKKYPFLEKLFHTSLTKEIVNYREVPLLVFPKNFGAEQQ